MQPHFEQANEGMTRALRSAERSTCSAWGEYAYAFMHVFAQDHAEFFPFELTAEFERIAPDDMQVPSGKAWGAIYRRAQKAGWLRKSDKRAPHPRRHGTEVRAWVYVP